LLVWAAGGGPRAVGGVPGFMGQTPNPNRLFAFGSWLPPDRASAIEGAIDRLRARGEGFDLALQTTGGQFLEAQGRAVAGRAVLRLRESTGDRLELQKASENLRKLSEEADTLRALLDALPGPAWRRDRLGRLSWVNASYAHSVEAHDSADATSRALEFLERGDRERGEQALRDRGVFQGKINAVAGGQRRPFDVFSIKAPTGSAGIAR